MRKQVGNERAIIEKNIFGISVSLGCIMGKMGMLSIYIIKNKSNQSKNIVYSQNSLDNIHDDLFGIKMFGLSQKTNKRFASGTRQDGVAAGVKWEYGFIYKNHMCGQFLRAHLRLSLEFCDHV